MPNVFILQENLCNNNKNPIRDKNSTSLLSIAVNNHTLNKESTEAAIKSNLEMLLNTAQSQE